MIISFSLKLSENTSIFTIGYGVVVLQGTILPEPVQPYSIQASTTHKKLKFTETLSKEKTKKTTLEPNP